MLTFSRGKEAGDRLCLLVEDARVGVDVEASHGVVEDGHHLGDVEGVFHLPVTSGEELLAPRVALRLGDLVVRVDWKRGGGGRDKIV
jgi:hypothetical protein